MPGLFLVVYCGCGDYGSIIPHLFYGIPGRLLEPGPLSFFRTVGLLWLLGNCTISDLRSLKIYNRVTYPALALMLLLSALVDLQGIPATAMSLLPWPINQNVANARIWDFTSGAMAHSLWGGLACGLALLPLWLTTGRGGGDLKLAVVIGTAIGPQLGLIAIGWTFVIGSAATLLWMMYRLGPLQAPLLLFRQMVGVLMPRLLPTPSPEMLQVLQRPIPLAGFFALGTLLALGGAV